MGIGNGSLTVLTDTITVFGCTFGDCRVSFQDILPPFPIVKNPDNFVVTFDVNFTTQVLTKFKKSKRFEDIHNLINQLHEERIMNEININIVFKCFIFSYLLNFS